MRAALQRVQVGFGDQVRVDVLGSFSAKGTRLSESSKSSTRLLTAGDFDDNVPHISIKPAPDFNEMTSSKALTLGTICARPGEGSATELLIKSNAAIAREKSNAPEAWTACDRKRPYATIAINLSTS